MNRIVCYRKDKFGLFAVFPYERFKYDWLVNCFTESEKWAPASETFIYECSTPAKEWEALHAMIEETLAQTTGDTLTRLERLPSRRLAARKRKVLDENTFLVRL